MNYVKTLLLALMLGIGALSSVNAAVISDSSSSNSWGENLRYYFEPVEDGPSWDDIYFTRYNYSASYDTDTGDGYLSYVVGNGLSQIVGVEYTATGGVWTQTSWAGDWMFMGPSFTQAFWNTVISPPVWP